jgi:tryptophan synthase alpha chain
VRDQVAANIPEALARIRRHTPLPVAVGFGIGTRAQVAQVAACADGVVVGSALVNSVRDNLAVRGGIAPALAAQGGGPFRRRGARRLRMPLRARGRRVAISPHDAAQDPADRR